MLKYITTVAIIFQSLLALHVNGQAKSAEVWNALQSKRGRSFIDEKGQSLGCDGNLECFPFDVIIYSASYDKSNRHFVIQGSVYTGATKAVDTTHVGGVAILLAQPCQDTLKDVRKIGMTVMGKKVGSGFPNRRGDFYLQFTASPKDKLYFMHGLFGLLEYNIDEIVSGKVML